MSNLLFSGLFKRQKYRHVVRFSDVIASAWPHQYTVSHNMQHYVHDLLSPDTKISRIYLGVNTLLFVEEDLQTIYCMGKPTEALGIGHAIHVEPPSPIRCVNVPLQNHITLRTALCAEGTTIIVTSEGVVYYSGTIHTKTVTEFTRFPNLTLSEPLDNDRYCFHQLDVTEAAFLEQDFYFLDRSGVIVAVLHSTLSAKAKVIHIPKDNDKGEEEEEEEKEYDDDDDGDKEFKNIIKSNHDIKKKENNNNNNNNNKINNNNKSIIKNQVIHIQGSPNAIFAFTQQGQVYLKGCISLDTTFYHHFSPIPLSYRRYNIRHIFAGGGYALYTVFDRQQQRERIFGEGELGEWAGLSAYQGFASQLVDVTDDIRQVMNEERLKYIASGYDYIVYISELGSAFVGGNNMFGEIGLGPSYRSASDVVKLCHVSNIDHCNNADNEITFLNIPKITHAEAYEDCSFYFMDRGSFDHDIFQMFNQSLSEEFL